MIRTHAHRLGEGKILAAGLLFAALAAASLLLARPAYAEDFVVTNTGGATVDGSLIETIRDANANPGRDTIKFDIPESEDPGVKTIFPDSGLESITDPVTIDGYSQPGSRPNTREVGTNAVILIEIDGSEAGSTNGLDIRADNVVVRGLAVNGFNNGIIIGATEPVTGARIEGNFIGTAASGTLDRGNRFAGVSVSEGGNNIIGGATPEKRNLISGQDNSGAVRLDGAGGNKVLGNLIGTERDGISPLPNGQEGVLVSSPDNLIGGAGAGAANTIAFNAQQGVTVDEFNPLGSTGNRILSNSIFSNGRLGIDLLVGEDAVEGPTPNDPKDPDQGPNTLQNRPVLTSATRASGRLTVEGKLNSTPSTGETKRSFTIQFFSNPSGNEGKTFLGQKRVATNGEGRVSFSFQTSKPVALGDSLTATATGRGGTSEFSTPVVVARASG